MTTGRVLSRWCLLVFTAFLTFTGGGDPAAARPARQPAPPAPGQTETSATTATTVATPGAAVRPVEEEDTSRRPLWVGAVVGGGGAAGLAFALWRAPARSPSGKEDEPGAIDRHC